MSEKRPFALPHLVRVYTSMETCLIHVLIDAFYSCSPRVKNI